MPDQASVYEKTMAHLEKLVAEGSLKSYWWTSDIYVYAFTVMTLARSGKDCSTLIGQFLAHQNEAGYWNNANAFYTALGLKSLLSYKHEKHKVAIEKAVAWLIKNQTTDGSWLTDRILRIPATDVTNPETVTQWRQSSFGVNALSDDHNRVFTTSTVVNALVLYSKTFKK
jgi:squalene cyclase